ncbi:DUF1294 domain-containing protein [Ramlibacter agri]|uniref:DUF1294 domain-containing protein n=1 Tax=Ramlibacter agri TaxID=2728837 RepID=UPI00197D3E22|nr:DUF1294 domain-containing protein [Ramlibacter agri]
MSSWVFIAAIYVVASVVAFCTYAFDKNAARRRARRISENTLHLLALAGGWPGAWLAQQLLRHKSSKAAFLSVFRITVALNVAGFVLACSLMGQVGWHAHQAHCGYALGRPGCVLRVRLLLLHTIGSTLEPSMANKTPPMNQPAKPGDPIDLATSVAGEEDPGASFDAPGRADQPAGQAADKPAKPQAPEDTQPTGKA